MKEKEDQEKYKKGDGLNVDALEQKITEIDAQELKDLIHKFHENMDTLYKMLLLPLVLCTDEFLGHNKLLLTLEARLASKTTDKLGKDMSEEDKKRYLEEEKRIWETKYKPRKNELFYEAYKNGEKKLNSMLANADTYKSYRSLLYSGIIFIWCNFEVIMKDLWETTLNKAGKNVKKFALENIGKIESDNDFSGVRGKYVNLDFLGQYNFNISNKLGSVLVNKFDFTSPYGIRNAFVCIFPRSTTIRKTLEREGLKQLEARRSVIVHRAGIIDSSFCKKTGTDQKEIGTNLQLSEEDVFEFGNLTIDVVLTMVKAVSSNLSSSKKVTL